MKIKTGVKSSAEGISVAMDNILIMQWQALLKDK